VHSNSRVKSYGHFKSLLNSGRPDLLVNELRLQSNRKENNLWKLVQKFKRDPIVGSKAIAILTRYSSFAE